MKKYLIIGIILLVISFTVTIITQVKGKNNYTNIHDITNTGSKLEGVHVSLDATYVAGIISGNNNYSYYVIFGDGVQYIVYMKNSEASKIQKYLLGNPEDSYKLTGITRAIPTNLEENGKKFIKEWLDNNHTHEEEDNNHSHDITTDDFYHYFGYVYFDNTVYESIVNKIIIYVTGIMGILFITYYLNTKYHLL